MSDGNNGFIPLASPFIRGNAWKYMKECLDSGWVSAAGGYIGSFEKGVAAYTRARHAVACSCGTAGLQVSLRLCGIGAGDEVIVPTVTFIAPVNAVRYLGAEPVFMDCDGFLNMDAGKLAEFCARECRATRKGLVNKKSGRTVKAVIPVHIFGNPCAMQPIMDVCRRYGLRSIEDATESLGTFFTEGPYKGRHTGTIADFGVFSFNGNKIITSGGGGMIVTRDAKAAEKARYLINQAKQGGVRYVHDEIGYNFRLNNIQAALGLSQLENIEDFVSRKQRNYGLYRTGLKDVPGITLLPIPEKVRPNYWFYSLFVDGKRFGMRRDELMEKLSAKGIETRPLWQLNHRQKPYRSCQAYRIERAPGLWERLLNIPCGAGLTRDHVSRVVAAIKEANR